MGTTLEIWPDVVPHNAIDACTHVDIVNLVLTHVYFGDTIRFPLSSARCCFDHDKITKYVHST